MISISETISSLASPNAHLESALFSCKILARRSLLEPLEKWAVNELTGYRDIASIPKYRIITAIPEGTYSNGQQMFLHRPIERNVVGNELYKFLSVVHISDSVSSLIGYRNRDDLSRSLTEYEGAVNRKYSSVRRNGYYYSGLTTPILPGVFDSVLASVKNCLMDFLFDIEGAIEQITNDEPLSDAQSGTIADSFTNNINIYFNQPEIFVGRELAIQNVSSNSLQIREGDSDSLINFFRELGINEDDIQALSIDLDSLANGTLNEIQEKKLLQWMSRVTGFTGNVTAGLVSQALINYAPAARALLERILST